MQRHCRFNFYIISICIGITALYLIYIHYFQSTNKITNTTWTTSSGLNSKNFPSSSSSPSPISLSSATSRNNKNISIYDQKDPELFTYILKHYIKPPSSLPYTIHVDGPSSLIQKIWPILYKNVLEISNGRSPFFVEAGANDGGSNSHSLWLEQTQAWIGLLIECHPQALTTLFSRHRKAFISNTCLSTSTHPTTSNLISVDGFHPSSSLAEIPLNRKVFKKLKMPQKFTKYTIQTIPLYSLLAAISVNIVDLFILDVQSLEYQILRNFPFHLILVKIWIIEISLLSDDELQNLHVLMKEHDYHRPIRISEDDMLFIHKSVKI